MTKFDQIEEFMEKLLDKLPEEEQKMVDPQIHYDTDRNSLEFMLNVNGTSPHFWMFYDPEDTVKNLDLYNTSSLQWG